MTDHQLTADSPEICLMLRAHAEQMWLSSEVLPVVRQLERPGAVPHEQVGAALAYLEMLWLDARQRAAETDAARDALEQADGPRDRVLCEKAHRYHAAVRRLRASAQRRMEALTGHCPTPRRRRRITERHAGL